MYGSVFAGLGLRIVELGVEGPGCSFCRLRVLDLVFVGLQVGAH